MGIAFRDEGPVITSLMDVDFYKFPMGQMIFLNHPDVEVTFSLMNRSRAPLAAFVPEEDLRRELDRARTLSFNNSDLHYLRGTNEYGERMFREEYLQFLRGMQLPSYELEQAGNFYNLQFTGPWASVTYWETIALDILSELYYRGVMKRMSRAERALVYATGIMRLMEKVKMLREYPGLTFSDFGTRRRHSHDWQDFVVEVLGEELPGQMLGTSNVFFARKHGLDPKGTNAHELAMVLLALELAKGSPPEIGSRSDRQILIDAQNRVLDEWEALYGLGLSIALTDTFGSDFFFKHADPRIAREWKGTRQDSGDPLAYGDKQIAWHEHYKVDPRSKLLVPSDGLTVPAMIGIFTYFLGRIITSFGPGTNITNDFGQLLDPMSIVAKVTSVRPPGSSMEYKTVKLSDNLAKASGPPELVERVKRAAGYTNTEAVACIY